jgi:P-type Ca2+ transporter type 2C
MDALRAYGGVAGLAKSLGSDLVSGLPDDAKAIAEHTRVYGPNKFKERPGKNFFVLCWENLQDPIILLLCAAALVSTVLGAAIPQQRLEGEWVEGIAIWVAVLLVVGVGEFDFSYNGGGWFELRPPRSKHTVAHLPPPPRPSAHQKTTQKKSPQKTTPPPRQPPPPPLKKTTGAGNDYQKDLQFRKLNAQKDVIEVKVIRGGDMRLVKNYEVVVGDLLLLDTGDKLIADGVLAETHGLVVDEASLTGESEPIKKTLDEDPWCRSGTQISEGSGRMLVVAVGERSEWGKTMALVGTAGSDDTPLQEKLADLAAAIGKVGFTVAVACFVALMIKWMVENRGFPIEQINNNGPVQFFLYAVTVVVVAIPEGLPLAVTIALAFSMKKMMRDNNFVRVLAACETMGGATAICSDKTGTLTENRMTVTEGWFAGKKYDHAPDLADLPHAGNFARELAANCALNSKAFLIENGPDLPLEFVGNRTECALLALALRKWGVDYKALRSEVEEKGDTVKLYGFSSAKKMASVLVRQRDPATKQPTGFLRLYNKGAAEWVLARCNRVVDPAGNVVPLLDAERERLIHEVVVGMASRGLRCICLTYTDYPENDPKRAADFFEDADRVDRDLVAMAIVGIKDPVRAEVPEAVRICQQAGIVVRMVTGDNIHTARHIAKECGILTDNVPGGGAGLALEGPEFRRMTDEELVPLLPRLQVLARSSPEDKLVLVRALKEHYQEVVAVTGDGTNDAPALKESDVGLAMGIAGTEVAKEGKSSAPLPSRRLRSF